ncbi:MAG: AAA family ATPase [Eubacteriales bacterium]|nr:AAA family ATPase [Eubacteriales bacterium]
MGIYLNGRTAYTLYRGEAQQPYFVDKSGLLEELFPMVSAGNRHICITRPRRFGKTVMANMVSAFFSEAVDAAELFGTLAVSHVPGYESHRNRYPVIHISMNELPKNCSSYEQYIGRIEEILLKDLEREYPGIPVEDGMTVWDALMELYADEPDTGFIFVLDEWDFIFHQDFVTERQRREYLSFLRNLLKDKPYVRLTYMTGILPIAKYSSGSELNMVAEYTMASEERFSGYFGFTEAEVDRLFKRYQRRGYEPENVSREGLRYWYDGYHTRAGERMYNPRSVVMALTNNNLGNYWTSAGPYDEIFYYIENNVDAVRDDLALMVSGLAVPARIQEYAATAQEKRTRNEIFSAMVVYGFLSYENGKVSIPNKELMDQFDHMLQKEPSLGYVYRLARESERMLRATLAQDTDTMTAILEQLHHTEIPLLSYNHETELTAIVNLAYLAARDTYRVEREDKAGKGFVDFVFYPETDRGADALILELKVDHTAREAIEQIKEKDYAAVFRGRLGEKNRYTGRILAVGIGYDRKKKHHDCRVEVLRELC